MAFQAVAYEYAVEMTYPLPEGTSANIVNVVSQVSWTLLSHYSARTEYELEINALNNAALSIAVVYHDTQLYIP